MPLSLSDDEYNAVRAAAAPIHPLQRDAFLKALAVELSGTLSLGRALCIEPPRSCRRLWCELLGHSIVVGKSVVRQS